MPSISLISRIKSKVKHQGEVAACKIKVDTAEVLGVAVHDTTPLASLKSEASELFKNGDSKGAKRVYTRAIAHTDLDPHEKAVLYCNRAAAEMKLRRCDCGSKIKPHVRSVDCFDPGSKMLFQTPSGASKQIQIILVGTNDWPQPNW
jgi:hypothetical protein